MNETRDPKDGQLGGLIRSAGPRSALPPDVEARLFQAAHAEWQAALRARRRTRRLYAVAAGAAVLAVGALLLLRPGARVEAGAAVIAATTGETVLRHEGRDTPIRVGAALHAGDVLRTSPRSGLVVRRADGLEVRLDAASELAWADDAARLDTGRVYVQSHAAPGVRTELELEARGVRVVHMGTEYTVDASTDSVVVAVRDGTVAMSTATARTVLDAGHAAEARGDRIAPLDGLRSVDWTWADSLAPALALDGRPVDDVLAEAAERAGLTVHYADATVRTRAHEVILRGPGLQLAPRDAIRAVLVAGGFDGEFEGRTLLVRAR